MRKSIIIGICACFMANVSPAQQRWTLSQCIDHAIANNITLKQKENQRKQNELQLSTARNARIPDLNAGIAENMSFGRGLTSDNTYSNTNTSSTSFSISTSVPILTGNRIQNSIRLAELNLQASTADLEKARENVSVQVAQQFIQILYDQEIIGVANRQIVIDSLQCERLAEMVRTGKASMAELSLQRATMAQSQLTLTQSENQYRLDILALSQLLELPSADGFGIVAPVTNVDDIPEILPSPEMIYAEAEGIKPEIAAEQLRLKATEKNILIAKSALYPSLSVSAGMGSNYYNSSGFPSAGFTEQMKNNFSQSIGVSLSVPIFNRFATRNNVRSAQIDRENQQLALDNARKALYKEIQQVHCNAVAANAKYRSSRMAEQSSADAFALMQAKYEAGKATLTEFNESKNNLLKAQSNLLQARYELVFQHALVGFYRGKGLTM